MTSTTPTSTPHGNSFGHHIKATLVLGMPLVAANMAQIGIGVTDTIMIGWLGAPQLAASVLAQQLFFIVYIFGAGFAFAIVPIAATAIGSGDDRSVRRSMRMGLWVVMTYSVFGLLIMSQSNTILQFLGQEPKNISLANDYLVIGMWGIFPALLSMALRSFLTSLELARIVLVATLGGVALNILLNYALIFGNFGAPRLEIVGAAWASIFTQMLIALILVIYILLKRKTAQYEIFTRIWIPDWSAMNEVLKLGLPMAIGILAEVGLFHAASVMMGWIGTTTLAAHGVALQIASISFMAVLGFSSAATVRVGNANGRNDSIAIGHAGYSALVIALIISIVAALLFVVFPSQIVRLFLDMANKDAAEVLAIAIPLVIVAAAFQFVDSYQGVMVGVLRGIKDISIPTRMGIFSYWIVGIPTAYILAFPLNLGGVGIWIGLAIGLSSASILMAWRFWHRERLGLIK